MNKRSNKSLNKKIVSRQKGAWLRHYVSCMSLWVTITHVFSAIVMCSYQVYLLKSYYSTVNFLLVNVCFKRKLFSSHNSLTNFLKLKKLKININEREKNAMQKNVFVSSDFVLSSCQFSVLSCATFFFFIEILFF